jgi:regulator of sigma E protease
MAILIFLIILVGLILVHELGHFVSAKLFGIRVDEFGIGFPPKLFGKKFGETEYTVNALPFGGFVRIFGENKEEGEFEHSARSFAHASRFKQALVLVAGVAMNVVAAWFLLSAGYMLGLPAGSEYTGVGHVTDNHVTVLAVSPDSPAQGAGIITGEKLVRIQAATGSFLESDALSDDVRHFIMQHSAEELTLTLERGNTSRTVKVTPKEGVVEGRPAVGFLLDDIGVVRLPVHQALIEGGKLTYDLTVSTAVGLWDFISNIFKGRGDFSSVAGPVGIVGIVGQAEQFGLTSLIMLAALISINLSIVNLIPFPALDGGRLVMVIIEGVTRRQLPPRVFAGLNMAGFAVLILLMLAVTYHDIVKLFV